jgi:hypothetical protein
MEIERTKIGGRFSFHFTSLKDTIQIMILSVVEFDCGYDGVLLYRLKCLKRQNMSYQSIIRRDPILNVEFVNKNGGQIPLWWNRPLVIVGQKWSTNTLVVEQASSNSRPASFAHYFAHRNSRSTEK